MTFYCNEFNGMTAILFCGGRHV